jgi:integrase/recombinase XerC
MTTINFSDAYTDFLLAKSSASLSANYLALLTLTQTYWLARWPDGALADITPEHIRLWLLWLMGQEPDRDDSPNAGMSSAAMHVHYRNLRAFLLWCEREEYLEAGRAPIRKVQQPRVTEREPDLLEPDEVNEILKRVKASPDKNAFRDYCIHFFFAVTGVRRIELARLNWSDLNIPGLYAKVLGKGNRERLVPLSPELARALLKYKRLYRVAADGADQDAVFTNEQGRRLAPEGIRQIIVRDIKRCVKRPLCKVGPHCYRRYTATMLLDHLPPADVRDILGHRSLETTLRYRRKSALKVVEGVNRVSLADMLRLKR